jgi:cyclic pyranopterin phosphate synthase
MVDVGEKPVTAREAVAEAWVSMSTATYRLLVSGKVAKGDVFAVARLAGIQAAKRTAELIPLCHTLQLTSVVVDFEPDGRRHRVRVIARARAADRTGVEMEALIAATVAALTVYDMCKAAERGITLGPIRLLEKRGGKSGEWKAR